MKRLFLLFIMTAPSTLRAGEPLDLPTYLREVQARNLTLKASAATLDAAAARASGIKLPEPMIGFVQMRDDSGRAQGFEISQTIPFPSKLSGDRRARQLEAQVEKSAAASTQKEILAQARLRYIAVWAARGKAQLLKEKKEAIASHLRLSRASTRSDSSLQIHTLKAESDLDRLDSEIIEAEQTLREQQIALAELVNQPPSTYRPELIAPPRSALPRPESLRAPVQLAAKRLDVERLDARETEARAAWYPDFNLRYRELGATGMTPAFNEIMVGATLPFVFFWEPRAAAQSARAEKMKAEASLSQETVRVEATTAALLAKAESLKKQMELIEGKLLPRAEKRMKIVHNLAPRDAESLNDHREAMEEFPELKLRALELRLQYENAIAELARFTMDPETGVEIEAPAEIKQETETVK